jgi:molecular chaperone GrpE
VEDNKETVLDSENLEENMENENMENDNIEESAEEVSDEKAPDEEKQEASDDNAAEQGENAEEKGGLFKKKDKKDKKDIQIEELTDKYKRTMAEFDNFRKRTEKEKSAMYEIGAKDIIEKILPVVDNFERGFKTLSEEEKGLPFADGMDKVYKQLIKTLEDVGVKPIEAVGKEFDPNLHNAVMHIEDESFDENTVAEEFQKGYMYRDSVVRHSMVKVAN